MTPISITQASVIGDYQLHLVFNDGVEQDIDFHPFLSGALHPAIRRFLEPACFANFHLEYGDLVWGDHELCFPIADLYENNLLHKPIGLAA